MSNTGLPLGINDFLYLSELNYSYVDKTDLVYQLANRAFPYMLLARPKGFGKTLLISTLKAYFMGKRDYFYNLKISKIEHSWEPYPVIHFDMADILGTEVETIKAELSNLIDNECIKEGLTSPDSSLTIKFIDLIDQLKMKYQKRVVVLIDNFDEPLIRTIKAGADFEAVEKLMLDFYSTLKPLYSELRLVLLAGTTVLPKYTFLSGPDIFYNISTYEPFASTCGFTLDEVATTFKEELDELSKKHNPTKEERLDKLSEMYGGYRFHELSPALMHPTSLLNCLTRQEIKPYWEESLCSTKQQKELQKQFRSIREILIHPSLTTLEDLERPATHHTDSVSALYQAGCLTIEKINRDFPYGVYYDLTIPNAEIRHALNQ